MNFKTIQKFDIFRGMSFHHSSASYCIKNAGIAQIHKSKLGAGFTSGIAIPGNTSVSLWLSPSRRIIALTRVFRTNGTVYPSLVTFLVIIFAGRGARVAAASPTDSRIRGEVEAAA